MPTAMALSMVVTLLSGKRSMDLGLLQAELAAVPEPTSRTLSVTLLVGLLVLGRAPDAGWDRLKFGGRIEMSLGS